MKKTAFVSVAIFIAAGVSATLMLGDEPKPTKPAATETWLHWPKVTVSKATTYFTGPLRADGSVDYVAAFNRRCSEGVTPENNAAVALWRASGPKRPRQEPPQAVLPNARHRGVAGKGGLLSLL